MDREAFAATAASIGLSLTSEQIEAFEGFEERLYRANEVKNLTRVPRADSWLRHFIDSLLVHQFLPEGAHVLDIGTGPGLPAWPLACARPDLQVTGLDSNGKMLGFLQDNLLPNLEAVLARAEEWRPTTRFDVVTGRAVAPLTVQLEISSHLVKPGGVIVPMRTARDLRPSDRALAELGLTLRNVNRQTVEGLEGERVFPVFEKFGKSAAKYPRRWAEIQKAPLPSAQEPL